MTKNMGTIDRAAPAFLVAPAATTAALALGPATIGGLVLFVVAGIMVATAAIGFCPLYALVGIDTRARQRLVHG